MDHIHNFSGSDLALQIPCLVDPVKSISNAKHEWMKYPEVNGFALEVVRDHQWARMSGERLAIFLQDWLFFGLLRAILPEEIKINAEEFISKGEDGKQYITTSPLPKYIKQWEEFHEKLPEDEKTASIRRNEITFNQASSLTYVMTHLPSAPSLNLLPPLPLECALSCAILGHTLSTANITIGVDEVYRGAWSSGELILEQLELQGWCPFIVDGLAKSHELSTLCYFATLSGPNGPKGKRAHYRCTEKRCMRTRNINSKHAAPCSACTMLKSPISEVVEAINNESTPALKYMPATDSAPPSLGFHAASFESPYVAISHVWSDGLGNQNSNAIPCCQAERLQNAVDKIFQGQKSEYAKVSGLWWLDTLCVPTEKGHEEAKAKAIVQMKKIYTYASSVLIIDSGLTSCNETMSDLEVLARLRLSNWIRRLWTLQEGYFAQSVYVLVGSTPRSWNSLVEAVSLLPREGFQKRIAWDMMKTYNSLFHPRVLENDIVSEPEPLEVEDLQNDKPVKETVEAIANDEPFITERVISDVIREVSKRAATKVKDEAQCLSLLLGLDTTAVLRAVEEDRIGDEDGPSESGMAMVFRLANEAAKKQPVQVRPRGCFPPSIIFPLGQRLRKRGFRWVPESFLLSLNSGPYSDELPLKVYDEQLGCSFSRPSGVLCERGRGLRVMFPGLIITKINSAQPINQFFIIDTSKTPVKGMPPFWRCTFDPDIEGRPWEGGIAPINSDSGKLAVIVGGFIGLKSKTGFSTILVRIKGRDRDGQYIVERLGRMVGSATPEHDDHSWVRDPWARVEGRWLPMNQMWCVDGPETSILRRYTDLIQLPLWPRRMLASMAVMCASLTLYMSWIYFR